MKRKPANYLSLPGAALFRAALVLLALLEFQGAGSWARADQNFYGTHDSSEAGLLGIIYDLKQTPKRKPTGVDPQTYPGIIETFLTKNWDESVLNPYFRAARPLYTTQVFIPMMGSDQAPKAFGMEAVIKPSCWTIHYKGQVSPPEDGVYRFVGGGDDFIAVAVNEKLVLFQCWWHVDHPFWTPKEPEVVVGQHSPMISGDWVALKKNEPVDLDVMIGEWPGGQSQAILLYQKQGVAYAKDGAAYGPGGGSLVLPIFQLAPFDTPVVDLQLAPHVLRGVQPWKGYQ